MEIGIGLPNAVRGASGTVFRDWARRAEERGFSALSTIDRIAYPSYDSLASLSVAAGATERISLVSAILLAPTHAPAMLAKAGASLHAMSGGRLVLGLATGGREDDFVAAERPFQTRGRDFDAGLELMHRAWAGEPVAGSPHPICPPVEGGRVPVLIGGTSDAAVRRTVRWGVGWVAGGGPPEMAAPMIERVRAAWKDSDRQGEPRIGGLAYFALGAEALEQGASNLLDYYAFLGPFAEQIAGGILSSEQALRDAVRRAEDAGFTELYLDPAASSLDS